MHGYEWSLWTRRDRSGPGAEVCQAVQPPRAHGAHQGGVAPRRDGTPGVGLARNAGHLMPHQALLDRVWGSDYEAGPEYLKVFISRVRAKLRQSDGPEYI